MELTKSIIKNLQKQIFPSCISSKTHKIFLKYSSPRYRKYCLDIIRHLSQKLYSKNSQSIFYQTLLYHDIVLYNCGNEVIINNLDLLILGCFYISIKSLNSQYYIPTLKQLKSLINEKFYFYKDNDIISTEIECLKLLNYNINYMNCYDFLKYFCGENNHLMDFASSYLENIIYGNVKYYIFKTPYELSFDIYNKVKEKMRVKSIIISVPPTKKKVIIYRNLRENNKLNSSKKITNSNYSLNNSSTDFFSTQNSSFYSKNCSPNEKNDNNKINNKIKNKTEYKRRISDVLNLSKNNKILIEQHTSVKSSNEFNEKKHESFSNIITSPMNNNILGKKGVNIDLKYLSTVSKKWDFKKNFHLINSQDYSNNSFVKKKLKFEENKIGN